MTALLEIGSVVRPHGIRGECIVALVTDRLERLAPGTHLHGELAHAGPGTAAAGAGGADAAGAGGADAAVAGGADLAGADTAPAAARTELEVLAARPHQGRFIVVFAGVADRDGAERLRGTRLYAEPISDPAAWFVHELIGCEVSDLSGNSLGTVTAVEANPASDLLVLDGHHLVPLRFVVERSAGHLVADPPPGLIE